MAEVELLEPVEVKMVYRVRYVPTGANLEVKKGVHGKFPSREEAEFAAQKCHEWFNVKKSVQLIGGKPRYSTKRVKDAVVIIDEFKDDILVTKEVFKCEESSGSSESGKTEKPVSGRSTLSAEEELEVLLK